MRQSIREAQENKIIYYFIMPEVDEEEENAYSHSVCYQQPGARAYFISTTTERAMLKLQVADPPLRVRLSSRQVFACTAERRKELTAANRRQPVYLLHPALLVHWSCLAF